MGFLSKFRPNGNEAADAVAECCSRVNRSHVSDDKAKPVDYELFLLG